MPFTKVFDVSYTKVADGKRVHSHAYKETWHETDLFCPMCGQRGIWRADQGDYYAGEQHICVECAATFTLPTEPYRINLTDETKFIDEANVQRFNKLFS